MRPARAPSPLTPASSVCPARRPRNLALRVPCRGCPGHAACPPHRRRKRAAEVSAVTETGAKKRRRRLAPRLWCGLPPRRGAGTEHARPLSGGKHEADGPWQALGDGDRRDCRPGGSSGGRHAASTQEPCPRVTLTLPREAPRRGGEASLGWNPGAAGRAMGTLSQDQSTPPRPGSRPRLEQRQLHAPRACVWADLSFSVSQTVLTKWRCKYLWLPR